MTDYLDAHQHFWGPDTLPGWLRADHPLAGDFTPGRLAAAMATTPVRATIAVQSDDSVEESLRLLNLARTTPWVAGVVGWLDPEGDVDAQLATLCGAPGADALVGVRLSLRRRPPEHADRTVAAISAAGLAIDLLADRAALPDVARLAAHAPRARIVLDHLGGPEPTDLAGWRRGLTAVAARPNVVAKVSGLTTALPDPDDVAWAVETARELLGPDRLLLGSDWPVCTLAGGYAETVHRYAALVGDDPRITAELGRATYLRR